MIQPISRCISFFQIGIPQEIVSLVSENVENLLAKLEGFTAQDVEGVVRTRFDGGSLRGVYVRKSKKTVRNWDFSENTGKLEYVPTYQMSEFRVIPERALLVIDGRNEDEAAKYISNQLFGSPYHQKPLSLIPSDFIHFRDRLLYVTEAEFRPSFHDRLSHMQVGGHDPDKADIVVDFVDRSEAKCSRLHGTIEFPNGKMISIDLKANGKVRFYFSSREDKKVLAEITARIIQMIADIILREEP